MRIITSNVFNALPIPLSGFAVSLLYKWYHKPDDTVWLIFSLAYNITFTLIDLEFHIQARIIAWRRGVTYFICIVIAFAAMFLLLSPDVNKRLSHLISTTLQQQVQAPDQSNPSISSSANSPTEI